MPTNRRRTRLLPLLGLATLLAACGDMDRLATAPDLNGTLNELEPVRDTSVTRPITTEEEAYAVANSYTPEDPLQPFSVSYDAFFADPEIVTDEQFETEEWRMPEWRVSTIEYDAGRVEGYCTTAFAADSCEEKYNKCVARCRRLRSPRARAICYAACMVAYAACLAAKDAEVAIGTPNDAAE